MQTARSELVDEPPLLQRGHARLRRCARFQSEVALARAVGAQTTPRKHKDPFVQYAVL